MCGIIGYIGSKEAPSILLNGLKRLEYRGYDSAGIAIVGKNTLRVYKEKGKISELSNSLSLTMPAGKLGIGHTRWATHGEPNKNNAHPHLDCQEKIAIVHNGIIENSQVLKEKLLLKNHHFISDTDSEVIAHLIEDYLREEKTLLTAVRYALRDLQGTYALAIISKDCPDKLIAARNGSPLIVGLGEGENFIASDIPAILQYTKTVAILDDYQIVEISPQKVTVLNFHGRTQKLKTKEIEWSLEKAQKKGFPHFMLKEIYEQPLVLRNLLQRYIDEDSLKIKFDNIFHSCLKISPKKIRAIKRIVIQACGSSYHAGLIGKYLLNLFSKIYADVEVSSEFRYQHIADEDNAFVVSVTQSGETTDTLMGLREAKLQRLKTLSLCNVEDSTIARESDAVLYTHAGPEIGVASTKAYTAQILIFYLLALYLGEKRGLIVLHIFRKLILGLKKIPHLMEEILSNTTSIKQIANVFYSKRDFLYLGRTLNYASALEGALKLKEIAYVHASAHPAGEMKHGPIALIDENVVVLCIAPYDNLYEKMLSNIREVKARKGKIITIATEGNTEIQKYSDAVIYVPAVEEYFYPLLTALPLQLFAYYVALKRGCEIDQPRNLAKSVTVE